MTDKELRKLGRQDLLEMLINQQKQMDALRADASESVRNLKAEIQKLREEKNKIELRQTECGSIAEASLAVSSIFSEAQKAAEVYLENVRMKSEKQDSIFSVREEEFNRKMQKYQQEVERACSKKIEETEKQCSLREAESLDKINAYWAALGVRLEQFFDSFYGLKKFMSDSDVETVLSRELMHQILAGGRERKHYDS